MSARSEVAGFPADIERVVLAIAKLAAAHGIPNTFRCHEVADESGLTARRVGWILRQRRQEVRRCAEVYGDPPMPAGTLMTYAYPHIVVEPPTITPPRP